MKKIFAFITLFVLVFAFASCDSTDTPAGTKIDSSAVSSVLVDALTPSSTLTVEDVKGITIDVNGDVSVKMYNEDSKKMESYLSASTDAALKAQIGENSALTKASVEGKVIVDFPSQYTKQTMEIKEYLDGSISYGKMSTEYDIDFDKYFDMYMSAMESAYGTTLDAETKSEMKSEMKSSMENASEVQYTYSEEAETTTIDSMIADLLDIAGEYVPIESDSTDISGILAQYQTQIDAIMALIGTPTVYQDGDYYTIQITFSEEACASLVTMASSLFASAMSMQSANYSRRYMSAYAEILTKISSAVLSIDTCEIKLYKGCPVGLKFEAAITIPELIEADINLDYSMDLSEVTVSVPSSSSYKTNYESQVAEYQ